MPDPDYMRERRAFDKRVKRVEWWAGVEGCEGGDLMRSLAHTAEMHHYAYSDEQGQRILDGTLGEAEKMIDYIVYHLESDNPDDIGYDEDEAKEILADAKRLGHE